MGSRKNEKFKIQRAKVLLETRVFFLDQGEGPLDEFIQVGSSEDFPDFIGITDH